MKLLFIAVALIACGRSDKEQPAKHPPPADAAPDADTFVLVGPPNAEALARAYLDAWAKASADGIRPLALTVEDNRGLYRCNDSRYDLDKQSQKSLGELFTPLVEAERLQRENLRVEIGAWEEDTRKSLSAGETVTFVCEARRPLQIVRGTLAFDVVDRKGKRDARSATFILVEAMGVAKLSTVVFLDLRDAPSKPPGR